MLNLLAWVAKDAFVNAVVAEAGRKKAPSHVLRVLADSSSEQVRVAVARNAKCPPKALSQLALDSSYRVRILVAKNPSAPVWLLREMLSQAVFPCEYNILIKTALASNPSSPTDMLAVLCIDDSPQVRRAIAMNPHSPESFSVVAALS